MLNILLNIFLNGINVSFTYMLFSAHAALTKDWSEFYSSKTNLNILRSIYITFKVLPSFCTFHLEIFKSEDGGLKNTCKQHLQVVFHILRTHERIQR